MYYVFLLTGPIPYFFSECKNSVKAASVTMKNEVLIAQNRGVQNGPYNIRIQI